MIKFVYTVVCLISLAQSMPLSESPRLDLSSSTVGFGRPQLNVPNQKSFVSAGLESKFDGAVSSALKRSPSSPHHPQVFWYEQITHDGTSPFIPGGEKWKVFRNAVAEYNADKSGKIDAQPALQKAINGTSMYISIYLKVLLTIEQMDLGTGINSVQLVNLRLFTYPEASTSSTHHCSCLWVQF